MYSVFVANCLDVKSETNANATYTNPVMNDNRPDPGIMRLDPFGFVVVTTSNYAKAGRDPALPIIVSKDLINWTQVSTFNSC